MSVTALRGFVSGVGLLGPGITSWTDGVRILRGELPWVSAPTVLPPPQSLPPAERRRTGPIVRLTLAAGLEASRHAGTDPARLPAVFSSSGGDGQNCHEICEALASGDRQLSPTRFHNSVHNAAAGYWGIATGATPASNALCAYDASFAAGLLEALTQLTTEDTPVLLLAYDAPYPEPIHSFRPIPAAFAVALVLEPRSSDASFAQIEAQLTAGTPARLAGPLEELRCAIPAARGLPLLELLARGASGTAVLDYFPQRSLSVQVSAWP
jgi:hypothetical protein